MKRKFNIKKLIRREDPLRFEPSPYLDWNRLLVVAVALGIGISAFHGWLFWKYSSLSGGGSNASSTVRFNEKRFRSVMGDIDAKADRLSEYMDAPPQVTDPS